MKKTYMVAVLALFAATSALAAVSVVGSRHDMVFSGFATGAGGSTEVCVFCHTPHGAQTSVTQAPLWNNTAAVSVDATMYTSATMNFVTDQARINATDARLCLACHDGGVGAPVNQPNSGAMEISTTTLMSGNALLTTNMSNDHPIGMDLGLTPEVTDPGIRPLATIIGATGFNENPFFGAANTMWCSTCHDVHDGDPLSAPFLRMSNAGSAMCKTCHIK
jgi:hypothetical protein